MFFFVEISSILLRRLRSALLRWVQLRWVQLRWVKAVLVGSVELFFGVFRLDKAVTMILGGLSCGVLRFVGFKLGKSVKTVELRCGSDGSVSVRMGKFWRLGYVALSLD